MTAPQKEKKMSNFRIWRASYWLIAILLLMFPSLCFAGDLDYPSSVQAERNGNWTAVINISNTDNPKFNIVPDKLVNTSVSKIFVVKTGDRTWRVTLGGRLINLRENGKVVFKADPAGQTSEGEFTIYSTLPTLSEWGLIILVLLLLTGAVLMLMRKRGVTTA